MRLSIPVVATPESGELETAFPGLWKPLLSDNISVLASKACYAPLSRQGLDWSIPDMHVVIKRFHGCFPTTGLTVSFFADPRFPWGGIFSVTIPPQQIVLKPSLFGKEGQKCDT